MGHRQAPAARLRSPAPASSLNLLLAVAVFALVVRLVYIMQISHAPFFDLRMGDARAYHEWALRIAGGDWLGGEVFYQAPLYPYFLATVYAVLGDGATVVRFIQAVIGAGSCTLLAAAGIALFGNVGAIAGVLLAIYPPAIFLDGLLDKSTLVCFFTTALLYLLSAGHMKFREFVAGVVLGLLTLTRENALLLAAPVIAWFVLGERADSPATHRRTWLTAFAVVAGCALVLVPVGVRNYAVGGEFLLTTSQFGLNFYIGNHAGATGRYQPLVPGHGSVANERPDTVRIAEEASGRTLSPSEVSSFWTARALDFIRTDPGAWLRLLARKLALTLNAVEIADTESQEVYAESSSLLRMLALFNFGVVLCGAAFGACLTIKDWRRLWWLYAIAITYTLSIITFFLFARYRFPLVPVLLLLTAGGLAGWRDASRPLRRWAFAMVIVAAVVTYLPLENTRTDRITHYVNIGNHLLASSRTWDQAEVFYDKALKESPRSPAAHFGLGKLLRLRERPKDAIGHYITAVEGWPDNADLRLDFASALEEVGDVENALHELNAVAELRPGDLTIQVSVGKLLLEQSRSGEAWKAFERALAIQPKNLDALVGSGDALVQLQRLNEAITQFRTALAVDPRNKEIQDRLDRAIAALQARSR